MVSYGILWSFLAVIDPNSFGLVSIRLGHSMSASSSISFLLDSVFKRTDNQVFYFYLGLSAENLKNFITRMNINVWRTPKSTLFMVQFKMGIKDCSVIIDTFFEQKKSISASVNYSFR